jgi:hypothetical protein
MTFTLEYDSADLARLQRALDKMDMQHLAQPMFQQIGDDIGGKAGVYPQWTDTAPPWPYWKRGSGWISASGKSSGTSQRLGDQWRTIVGIDTITIKNAATYAGYVHGPEQTEVHKTHGWLKLLDVAIKELPGVIKKLEARALKLWNETV